MSRSKRLGKKDIPSVTESILHYLYCIMSFFVTLYMLLILGVMPFYNSQGYEKIGTDKAEFFMWAGKNFAKIVLPVLFCIFLLSIIQYFRQRRKRKININFSVTDLFAAAYAVSLLLSFAASRYKETALWGTKGWYMGLLPQLILLSSYFLISRYWNRKIWILYTALAASAVVFLLGCLNRFGIYPIDMKMILPSFISTIGNINWYCGYLVSVFFGGVYFLWRGEGRVRDIFLTIYVLTGFFTLITQGSSSGILTLLMMLLAFFLLSVPDAERMQHFWRTVLLLGIACTAVLVLRLIFPEQMNYVEPVTDILTYSPLPVLIICLSALCSGLCLWSRKNGRYPQRVVSLLGRIICIGAGCGAVIFAGMIAVNTVWPGTLGPLSRLSVFTFSPDWGSNRGATWKAALMCFAEQDFLHKLTGVGPDCMSGFLYQNGSGALLEAVRERFSGLTLTNAHNEWLTILVNTGLLGAVSYIGMMVSAIVRYLRKPGISRIAAMAGICLLAYTINNMFSFQQAMNTSTIFVIWGMGEACARKHMK